MRVIAIDTLCEPSAPLREDNKAEKMQVAPDMARKSYIRTFPVYVDWQYPPPIKPHAKAQRARKGNIFLVGQVIGFDQMRASGVS